MFPVFHGHRWGYVRTVKRHLILLCFGLCASTSLSDATPAAADRARRAYQLGVERWILETRIATTTDEHEAAARNRPDPLQAAREVWQAIAPELDRDWILPHAAWFIEMTDSLAMIAPAGEPPAFNAEITQLLRALRDFHLQSANITPVCLALAQHGGPDRLAILEKIREEHPEKSIRGVAALTQAIAMKSLGDEPAVIAKRLELIRQAIIESADLTIRENTTVAAVAEEELYIIRNLTRGRTAPDLTGMDTAGRTMKLSDHAGKVIILVFWSAEDPNVHEVIDFASALQGRMRGRPVEILGVNLDVTATLRPMEADGRVTWRNFSDPGRTLAHEFRVTGTPVCFILDGDRTIQQIGPPGPFIEFTAMALLDGGRE
jgi:peroxiredoxin